MRKLKAIKQRLLNRSTKNSGSTGSQMQTQQLQQGKELQIRYYQNIIDLPLRHFITCQVDGNLSALTIEGFPTPEQLVAAWIDIRQEFNEAIGDQEHRFYATLCWEVGKLKLTFDAIQMIVKLLENVHSKKFVAELNELLNTSYKLDPSDQVKYRKELQSCLNRSKSLKIKHDLKNAQLEAIRARHQGGEKPTREYYITYLIVLTNHAKFRVDDSISTFEYCARVKEYNEYYKRMEELTAKK